MSTKSHKPSRQDLLDELEAIRTSLLPEEKINSDKIAQSKDKLVEHSALTITQERPAIDDNGVDTESYDYMLEIPNAPDNQPVGASNNCHSDSQDGEIMTTLPGQQSLFESTEETAKANAPLSKGSGTKQTHRTSSIDIQAENPFLPTHVKERLQKEKSLYQKEIDAAAKLPGLNPYASKPDEHDALIDELVEIYLPRIEQDLRKRIKERLKKSQAASHN